MQNALQACFSSLSSCNIFWDVGEVCKALEKLHFGKKVFQHILQYNQAHWGPQLFKGIFLETLISIFVDRQYGQWRGYIAEFITRGGPEKKRKQLMSKSLLEVYVLSRFLLLRKQDIVKKINRKGFNCTQQTESIPRISLGRAKTLFPVD